MINHPSKIDFRKVFTKSMRKPPIAKPLMLVLYVFRKRYRYPQSANPSSEHDLSFNTLSEASNHAFQAQVNLANKIIPNRSGIKRGVIYARANGREKQKIVHNLRRQVELVRRKMRRDHVKEVEDPITDVSSGLDFERKGLKRLLEIACAKRIDCVYVSSLDRLGRHVFETRHFIYRFSLEGVVVRWIEEEECNSDD